MPNSGRVLRFRRPVVEYLSTAEGTRVAQDYLDIPATARSLSLREGILGHPETVFALCKLLRERMNIAPADVEPEVQDLYEALSEPSRRLGYFDERDFLRGDVALIASTVSRHLGKLEEAERWLDRAESALRHIVNPGPMLASLAYARLALRYDKRCFDDVLELIPSVINSFKTFGMQNEYCKARFLQAMTLKENRQPDKAFEGFCELRTQLATSRESALLGMVLVEIGSHEGSAGRYADASTTYREALLALAHGGHPMTIATLKGALGETYRSLGDLESAAHYFRAAVSDHAQLQMAVKVAYSRIVLAETLIALNRAREAEWQILAALPTIDEQKMVPEGFAAVALLKESVRRRKTDPNALRELREHLQASK